MAPRPFPPREPVTRGCGYHSAMLLEVERLRCEIESDGAPAVDDVSLAVAAGETLALVGESGCGKSLTALSIPRLAPAGVRIARGRIGFEGRDLLALPERELRRVRGNRVGMIFQEPLTSLNPVLSIGMQVAEPLRLHRGLPARAAAARAVELLEQVGIRDPAARARSFPHELSGGMRQRAMIAMAIACEPALLIADEPTTALDVTVQRQILELLRTLQRTRGMALLLITHDLGVVAEVADRVCVMYAGRIVEQSPAADLLRAPRHPYTRALLRSMPTLDGAVQSGATGSATARRQRLPVIPGDVPRPATRPAGCAFHPRCEAAEGDPRCLGQVPELELLRASGADRVAPAGPRFCACWKNGEISRLNAVAVHG